MVYDKGMFSKVSVSYRSPHGQISQDTKTGNDPQVRWDDNKADMTQAKRTGSIDVEENGEAVCHVIDGTTRYDLSEEEKCPKSVSNSEDVNVLSQDVVGSRGHRKQEILWN